MSSYRMSQTVDLNQVEPSTIAPNPNPKPFLNWGRILSTTNSGHVGYNGLQSELNMRARGGLTFQASHVWAKNLGNVGGDAPTAFNPEIIYGTPRQWRTGSIFRGTGAIWRERGATGFSFQRFTTYLWGRTANSLRT